MPWAFRNVAGNNTKKIITLNNNSPCKNLNKNDPN